MSDDETKTPSEVRPDDADPLGTFREAREYAAGNLDVAHHDVHPFAGLVDDDDVAEVLAFMASVYEPIKDAGMPASFWETDLARETIKQHATAAFTNAVDDGNATLTAFMSGLPSYQSDVSGLQAINQLADWLVHSEQCKLIYMAALMGRGKTDLAVTFFEVIHDHYRRIRRSLTQQGRDDLAAQVPVPEFAANFEVTTPDDVDVDVIELRDERALLEWAEGGSSDLVRWFIFDEASTALTAQSGANAQKVADRMAPFVKRMRKVGVNMIVIGHDKGDVHIAIRSLADFVDKTGLKTASFYAGINQREPVGHLFDLAGIPPTGWGFNTDDMAEWSWADVDGAVVEQPQGMTQSEFKRAVLERAARLWATTDVNQETVAQALSGDDVTLSRSSISRVANELGLTDNGPNNGATA